MLDKGYPAYLKYPATDWETFMELKKLGVRDLVIDGPLCYQMDKISKGKENMNIRVNPIFSINSALTQGLPQDFFIRPEDLSYYSAIDYLDFNITTNKDKEDALFSIYSKQQFNYSLENLFPNIPYDINNSFFKSDFAEQRANCGQKCKVPGGSCHFCNRYFALIKHSIDLIEKH